MQRRHSYFDPGTRTQLPYHRTFIISGNFRSHSFRVPLLRVNTALLRGFPSEIAIDLPKRDILTTCWTFLANRRRYTYFNARVQFCWVRFRSWSFEQYRVNAGHRNVKHLGPNVLVCDKMSLVCDLSASLPT